jgi:hypothetical protein
LGRRSARKFELSSVADHGQELSSVADHVDEHPHSALERGEHDAGASPDTEDATDQPRHGRLRCQCSCEDGAFLESGFDMARDALRGVQRGAEGLYPEMGETCRR